MNIGIWSIGDMYLEPVTLRLVLCRDTRIARVVYNEKLWRDSIYLQLTFLMGGWGAKLVASTTRSVTCVLAICPHFTQRYRHDEVKQWVAPFPLLSLSPRCGSSCFPFFLWILLVLGWYRIWCLFWGCRQSIRWEKGFYQASSTCLLTFQLRGRSGQPQGDGLQMTTFQDLPYMFLSSFSSPFQNGPICVRI